MAEVNKGGRPRVGPQHAVRMPEEDWGWVEEMARLNGLDRSRQVAALVRQARVAAEASRVVSGT